jgi:uncharacterized metal-binding protein YceD (DUF177 family)
MWEGMQTRGPDDVDAKFRVSSAGTGEVIARGHVHGLLAQECRRCLEPVEREFDEDSRSSSSMRRNSRKGTTTRGGPVIHPPDKSWI